jgi:hypothetical protein
LSIAVDYGRALLYGLALDPFFILTANQVLILFTEGPPADCSSLHSMFNCSSYNPASVAGTCGIVRKGIRPDPKDRF